MADITWLGATWQGVGYVALPKMGGGEASFHDLSGDTLSDASQLSEGVIAHLADGTRVTGTSSGGGTPVKTKTGTVTGGGTTTLAIPCDFEPDLIYVYGDMSASASNRGVVSITILKDVFAYMSNDSSTSNANENFTIGDHSISGYGDSTNLYATYSNGTLTIDTVSNTSARRFRSGQTYNYRLVKWT